MRRRLAARGAAAVIASALGTALGVAAPQSPAPAPPSAPAPAPRPAAPLLVVVHQPGLEAAAQAWVDYRRTQGWAAETLAGTPEEDATALRSRLHRVIRSSAAAAAAAPAAAPASAPAPAPGPGADPAGVAVLLLGDSLPTFMRPQPDPALVERGSGGGGRRAAFATDAPYQDLDEDGVPDLMLGRVSATSAQEAEAYLARVKATESAPPGPGSTRVEVAAGEGRFGPYDSLLEMLTTSLLASWVPPTFDLRAAYAKASSPFCPPPSMLPEVVREQALGGALLFNYVGHGHSTGLDSLHWHGGRVRIMEADGLNPPGAPPAPAPGGMALLVCCSAGWYDLPDHRRCLAEELIFHPRGPLAVIAGSRPTHPYANAIVEREALTALLRRRAATAGEVDLAVTRHLGGAASDALDLMASPIASLQRWPLSLRALRRQHAELYNLIGDPALRLPLPPAPDSIVDLRREGRRVVGRVPGCADGRVTLDLVAPRSARPAGTRAASGPMDPLLEERARANWKVANEWVRARAEAELKDGLFQVPLPEVIPEDATMMVIRVSAPGRPLAAIAWLPVTERVRDPGAASATFPAPWERTSSSWRD